MLNKKFSFRGLFRFFQFREIEKTGFHYSFLHFLIFLTFLIINCAEEKKNSDSSAAIGLLGAKPAGNTASQSSGSQTNLDSGDAVPQAELPQIIPPIIGPPAAPGQPLNAPVLNDPQILVNNAPGAEDPYEIKGQILISNITFQLPVHNQTTITAYIGKRNMSLEANGTVVNVLDHHSTTLSLGLPGGAFRFFIPSNRKQKMILVARNEFGSSSKTIDFYHNRSCAGLPVVTTTATIGNCGDYCIETNLVNGDRNFEAKYTHGNLDYLFMDISGHIPSTGGELASPNFYESAQPLQTPGMKSVSTTLLPMGHDYMCIYVYSNVQVMENQILQSRELNGVFRLE